MSLEELYFLSQIIAAVALVASLLFVALQLRQNTRQMKSSQLDTKIASEMAGLQMTQHSVLSLASDETLSEIVARGRQSLTDLSPSERRRFGHYLMGSLYHTQFAFLVYYEGGSSDNAWQGHGGNLAPMLRSPGGREWWRRHRQNFVPEYRAWIDGLAGEGPLMPPGLPEGHPYAALVNVTGSAKAQINQAG